MSMRFIKSTICMCLLVVLVACGSNFSQSNNAGNRQYTDGNYDAALREYQSAQVSAFDRPEAYFNAALAFAGFVVIVWRRRSERKTVKANNFKR